MKNTMKKLNIIIHEKKCNTIQIIRSLKTKIKINEKIFEIFINSKVILNFIL